MIRAFLKDYNREWDLLLLLLEFMINTSISEVTMYPNTKIFEVKDKQKGGPPLVKLEGGVKLKSKKK